jgi:8-oxo-dGTP diphosphatase
MPYTYDYEMPAITTDMVVIRKQPLQTEVLLIKRGNEPYKGWWALPGGFANKNERLIDCAIRELQEETTIVVPKESVRIVGTFDEPGRDPRGWTITSAYTVEVPKDTQADAQDDADGYKWVPLSEIITNNNLAFDHYDIICSACRTIELGAKS